VTGSSTTSPTQDDVLTTGAGLVDRTDRGGRLALTGAGSRTFLNGQVSNEIEALAPGTGTFATFLTPKGKMLGDVRVLDVSGDGDDAVELLLDTERVALQALFDMLRRTTIGHATELHKRTLVTSQLSLVGPRSRDVAGVPALPATEHDLVRHAIAGVDVVAVATDAGVDLLIPADGTAAVRAALEAAGAVPVDERAADVLRVEAGRPRYGVDVDDGTMPEEAGLVERAVSFTKGCYVGQETVARLHWRGKPNRHLRGVRLDAPVPAGTALWLGEREVGVVTSPVHSPRHGDIALALVRREAEPGAVLRAGDEGAQATLVTLPF
jgi:folate-binding protein YgfZ